jgi:thiamine kinase-like enzyme
MSSLLGKCIGSGGCSEVFEWGNDKVIKLFRSNTDENAVNREYNNSVAAWKSGLPTYRPYEKIEFEGRLGIIYERINGQTLIDRFLSNTSPVSIKTQHTSSHKFIFDNKDNEIRTTASILYNIHQKSITGLPNQAEMIKSMILRASYLTEEEKQYICEVVDNLPSKGLLCHGDPNPGNFIIRDDKPVIIDWMNATRGNPASDIAEYIIMVRYAVLPPEIKDTFGDSFDTIRESIIQIFVEEYVKLSNIEYEEIDQWLMPVMAGKLSADSIPDKEKKLLVKEIRKRLQNV